MSQISRGTAERAGGKLPELLSPAGSFEALAAAIEGGADAVYFGGTSFNARLFASNFDGDALREAVRLCHGYGVRAYVTLNTLPLDREMKEFLQAAEAAYLSGADALIVADLGGAAAIHRMMPDMELHASTQASGHSADAGVALAKLGFSRMVCAREMPLSDLRAYTAQSPIESEVFIHGALCVCHSGQCLFSSMVGGRSGNRGACAQPCRLPYTVGNGRTGYPLSLKDLCLGQHVTELIDAGVSSLKIEGRMKAPEYVYAVTRIWRRLLDERRNATAGEMRELSDVFSRGGFTDSYFTHTDRTHPGTLNREMLGVRSEQDKETSRSLTRWEAGTRVPTRRVPLTLEAEIRAGVPSRLTACDGLGNRVEVTGEVPQTAQVRATDEESAARSLSKLGGTPYQASRVRVRIDEGLMMPAASLNALRRAAVEALEACRTPARPTPAGYLPKRPEKQGKNGYKSACFRNAAQIPPRARTWFDVVFLPLAAFDDPQAFRSANGVILPPVIMDHEKEEAARRLSRVIDAGIRHVLLSNVGHLTLLTGYDTVVCHGDFRLNVTNRESAAVLESLGFDDYILSPELTLPQLRDVGGSAVAFVYGRIPLMLLEKCVIREIASCETCAGDGAVLIDRKGVAFPVLREQGTHRNVIYNSLPTDMGDRRDELNRAGIGRWFFLFSTESAAQVEDVLTAWDNGETAREPVRRIARQ